MNELKSKAVILYDGVCGLCNRLNQFVLPRDTQDQFRFAALQSGFAQSVLERHGRDARDLDTLYVVVNPQQSDEYLLWKSAAALLILMRLGGIWKLSAAARIFPRAVRDWVYDRIARNRYRIFGKFDACLLPEERYRSKFLDVESGDL